MACTNPLCSCNTQEIAKTSAAVLARPRCSGCPAVLIPGLDTGKGADGYCRNCAPKHRKATEMKHG
jgi:hypothetical protein